MSSTIYPWLKRRTRAQANNSGVGVIEAVFAVAFLSVVLLAVFSSSISSIASSEHTVQTFEAEDLLKSAIREVKEDTVSWGTAKSETKIVKKDNQEYSVQIVSRAYQDFKFCAEVSIDVTWDQGKLHRKLDKTVWVPLKEAFATGTSP